MARRGGSFAGVGRELWGGGGAFNCFLRVMRILRTFGEFVQKFCEAAPSTAGFCKSGILNKRWGGSLVRRWPPGRLAVLAST